MIGSEFFCFRHGYRPPSVRAHLMDAASLSRSLRSLEPCPLGRIMAENKRISSLFLTHGGVKGHRRFWEDQKTSAILFYNMSNIIGHTRHIEYFNTVLQRGKLAHAHLFYGPERVGKYTFARHIAKIFYCVSLKKMFHLPRDRVVSGTFDGVCNSCSECRMIDEGRHPNVILLDTEHALVSEKETRKEISIDDIRELRRRFSFAGNENEMRIAIVNNAHMMSLEAAGAFLKILEEPGAYILFILIAPEKDALLQTIVSRTHAIYFAPVSESAIREYIASFGLKEHAELIRYAAGRPGVIINMFADAEYRKREQHMREAVRFLLSKNDISYALFLSEKIASDAALMSRARFALFFALRDELLAACGKQAKRAVEKIKKANDIFSTMDTSNVQTRLSLDTLFLYMMK